MASTGELDADRDEFWARKAAERRRRSSSNSQNIQQPQLAHPIWVRPRDQAISHQPFLRPDYGQQLPQNQYSKPRAMSDASRPHPGNELQTPLRPYPSYQSDRGPHGRRVSMSNASTGYHDPRRQEPFDPRYQEIPGAFNRAGSQTYHGQYAPDPQKSRRRSSPTHLRAISQNSRDYAEPQHRQSPKSDRSGWDDEGYSRRHRSRSSVSHGEKTVEDIKKDLRKMHPTRAYLHDKKDQYVREKPMQYPRSGKKAANVAAGGVAGALGVAGATEAIKHDSWFDFGDFFDCGFCDCAGL